MISYASAVPLQLSSFANQALEVFVGTPAQRFMLVPDFTGDEVRLFMGAEIRSPFLDPVAHSSSLASDPEGRTCDNITIGDVELRRVPVSLERTRRETDVRYYGDSDGRIGLGPQSLFALNGVVTLSPCRIETTRTSLDDSLDVSFSESIPPLTPEYADVTIPLVEGASSWNVPGQLRVLGQSLSVSEIEIEWQPELMTVAEMPRAGMERLTATLTSNGVPFAQSHTGRLALACDSRGRFINPPEIELVLPGIGTITLAHPEVLGPAIYPGLCFAGFNSSPRETAWRVNPQHVKGLAAMYLDGAASQLTVRTHSGPMHSTALRVLHVAPAPRIPTFSGFHSLETTAPGLVSVRFAPVDNPVPGQGFIPSSLRPQARPTGGYMYTFQPLGLIPTPASTAELPGLYALAEGPELKILRPTLALELRLREVPASWVGRKYKVWVVRASSIAFIQLSLASEGVRWTPEKAARVDAIATRTMLSPS